MRNLVRKPLFWMVFGECAVIAALVFVAWRLVVAAPAQASFALPGVSPFTDPGNPAASVPADVALPPSPGPRLLLPGLSVDPNFWRLRLAALNKGEADFEVLEWRLVHSAMDSARRYVQSVVLPSIAKAEKRRT
jgi:hypothetical protein